jgi:hypothetical protein
MARRIGPIFDSILADARIVGRERTFVESLRADWQRKGGLTPGRRRCLRQIEERLAAAPKAIEAGLDSRLSSLEGRASAASDDWAVRFVRSIRGQVLGGRALSTRQMEILGTLEDRHSDEAQAERDNWASSWASDEDRKRKFKIALDYYATTGYYSNVVKQARENPDFVPDRRLYKKVTENKFATRVIESTLAEAKWKAGDLVMLNSAAPVTTPWGASLYKMRGSKGTIVAADAAPVRSAARKAKVYRVLFFGHPHAVFVEERWLKKARR